MMGLTVPEDRTGNRVAVHLAQGHCHCSFDILEVSMGCRGVPTR